MQLVLLKVVMVVWTVLCIDTVSTKGGLFMVPSLQTMLLREVCLSRRIANPLGTLSTAGTPQASGVKAWRWFLLL